jgi:hypothetical protein
MKRIACPNCGSATISPAARFFAYWPFSAKCVQCRARVRAHLPLLLNLIVQVAAIAIFWAGLLFGIDVGSVTFGALLGLLGGGVVLLLGGLRARVQAMRSRRQQGLDQRSQ